MKNFSLVGIVVLIILSACEEPRQEAPELLGTWEPTWFIVMDTTTSFRSMDFDLITADSTDWEKKMRLKPARTTYYADGTFKGEHRTVRDSVFVTSSGTWDVRGDSLYFRQFAPDTFIATYWYMVKEDTLRLKGIIDWSRNGKQNDKFEETQKRIK